MDDTAFDFDATDFEVIASRVKNIRKYVNNNSSTRYDTKLKY